MIMGMSDFSCNHLGVTFILMFPTIAIKNSKQEMCVMFDVQRLTYKTLFHAAGKSRRYRQTKIE